MSRPRPPLPERTDPPLAILTRWWFWLAVLGLLWSFPLVKSLGAKFPDPLPGIDSDPVEFTLTDIDGRQVSPADLDGYLKLVSELPLANRAEAEATLAWMRRLRTRLRGLGSSVVYVTLCQGGTPADVVDLLAAADEPRKPVNVYLMDDDRATMAWLRREAGSETADILLLDRHGRVRGVFGRREGEARMSDDEVDRLVAATGQLANWVGEDPTPGATTVGDTER